MGDVMDLWTNPLEGRELYKSEVETAGLVFRVYHDRATQRPIRDRFDRLIESVGSDGRLLVVDDDGYVLASGLIKFGQLRINMYTGESFRDGIRTRLAVRGPRSVGDWSVASDDEPGVARIEQ